MARPVRPPDGMDLGLGGDTDTIVERAYSGLLQSVYFGGDLTSCGGARVTSRVRRAVDGSMPCGPVAVSCVARGEHCAYRGKVSATYHVRPHLLYPAVYVAHRHGCVNISVRPVGGPTVHERLGGLAHEYEVLGAGVLAVHRGFVVLFAYVRQKCRLAHRPLSTMLTPVLACKPSVYPGRYHTRASKCNRWWRRDCRISENPALEALLRVHLAPLICAALSSELKFSS